MKSRKSKWVQKKSFRIQTISQIVCDSGPFAASFSFFLSNDEVNSV